MIVLGHAVKTLESKETRAFKESDGNAQFSLCCTSTAMPDDESQDRHPAFCFAVAQASCLWDRGGRLACRMFQLLLDPRHMPSGKLPSTVAFDQRVRELHDSIERFAVRRSFHARFPEDNSYVIAVKPR